MKFSEHESPDRSKLTTGLVANGSHGSWVVDIDEADSQWFAQIEGPSIYVNFQIDHPRVVEELIDFLEKHLASATEAGTVKKLARNEEMRVGHFGRTPVSFIWDAEGDGRCIVLIAGSGESKARLTLLRADVRELLAALCQVREDLDE